MDKEREKVIARFLEFDRISNMQFKQYFKGFELLRRWMMKHHSLVVDFTNLDLEVVDIEILADEGNEREGETIAETTRIVEEEGAVMGGANDEAQTEAGYMEETINAP